MPHKTRLICCLIFAATTALAGPTVIQLQEDMTQGKLTAEQLTQHALNAIERLNPQLNAVISTNPKALEQAASSLRRKARIEGFG